MLHFPHNRVLSSAPWTPRHLGTTLGSWFAGESLSGAHGAEIPRWTDLSGRQLDLTSTGGAAAPTVEDNVVLNLRAAAFNGTSQFFSMNSGVFSGATEGSAYLVVKCVEDPNTVNTRTGLWNLGTDSGSTHFTWTDGSIYEAFGTTVRKAAVDPTPSMASWRIYHVYSAPSDWAMYLDGVSILSTGTNTVGFPASPTLGQSLTSTIFFYGWIAEAIFTRAKQSNPDREKVEGYLAHKYGLQANLASSHPYRTSRP